MLLGRCEPSLHASNNASFLQLVPPKDEALRSESNGHTARRDLVSGPGIRQARSRVAEPFRPSMFSVLLLDNAKHICPPLRHGSLDCHAVVDEYLVVAQNARGGPPHLLLLWPCFVPEERLFALYGHSEEVDADITMLPCSMVPFQPCPALAGKSNALNRVASHRPYPSFTVRLTTTGLFLNYTTKTIAALFRATIPN